MTSALPLVVTGAVLLSALAHAGWNAIAHAIEDKLTGFVLLGLGAAACAVVVLLVAPAPARASWPFLAGSAATHVVYNVLLMTAYRLGDFGQVYPLARGTSPLVVTLLAAVFVAEVPTPWALAGIVVVSTGLATLAFLGGGGRAGRPALVAAVATGLVIAGYTTVDGIGVRLSGSPAGYAGWLMFLNSLAVPAYAAARWRASLLERLRPHLWRGLAGGVLSVGAYALVLWAQTRGALGAVAALRESSVVVGAVIGTVVFRERFGSARIVGSVLVATGIVLLAVG
ncbi:MAG TPA: EamA family transporter [Segeticoccus sp.]|uniref:EamA family transporter n=1 Tax=Segeticoccus sp. TaxID=2706531 RepID=UPI002D804B1B|nr:EamA family transporter [Segeticoccus sp.]HET8600316.1 EamA family transporter [Segeticoccus sp.]